MLLLNNGIDHHPPQREIIDLINYINSQRREYKLEHSNFERYVSQIKKYKQRFKKFTGELRGGFRHWVLSGVSLSKTGERKNANPVSQSPGADYYLSLVIWKRLSSGNHITFVENTFKKSSPR